MPGRLATVVYLLLLTALGALDGTPERGAAFGLLALVCFVLALVWLTRPSSSVFLILFLGFLMGVLGMAGWYAGALMVSGLLVPGLVVLGMAAAALGPMAADVATTVHRLLTQDLSGKDSF